MAELPFGHSEEWMEKLTDETLSPIERRTVNEHVESCLYCRRYLNGFYQLPKLFQNMPAPDRPPGLPPRLQRAMQMQVRPESPQSGPMTPKPTLKPPSVPVFENVTRKESHTIQPDTDGRTFEEIIRRIITGEYE